MILYGKILWMSYKVREPIYLMCSYFVCNFFFFALLLLYLIDDKLLLPNQYKYNDMPIMSGTNLV